MSEKPSFLEILTATFAAGETKIFALAGSYFELIALPNTVDVRLVDLNGAQRGLMRGAGASFYITAAGFDTIEITSPTAQTVRFAFGSALAGTRSTSGTVNVTDGSQLRTVENRAFVAHGIKAAFAGQIATLQLFNPAASGKNLYVTLVRAKSAGALLMMQLGPTFGAVARQGQSKRAGGAASVAELRDGWGVAGGVVLLTQAPGAGVYTTFEFKEPIMLPPAFGLAVHPNDVNLQIDANFEYFEEAA